MLLRQVTASIRAKHVALAIAVFGAWELSGFLVNPVLWPPLHSVVVALVSILLDGSLITALGQSLILLALGLTAAFVSGIVVGTAVGRSHILERMVVPFMGALYATPTVALIPLLLVWFGFGISGRVVVVWLIAFFPMLVNVYAGVRDTPQDLIEVARSFDIGGELALLRRVVLPSALPLIMAGVRLSIGRAIVGMAVAEVYLRLSGLGALITEYGAVFQTDYVLATILPLPVLGIVLTKVAALVEHRLQYWRPQTD